MEKMKLKSLTPDNEKRSGAHPALLTKGIELGTQAQVENALQDIEALEHRYYSRSRFRRFSRCVEPLVDFLVMYSPAVDMLVQYDVSPSAIVWGSLKALLQVRFI